jgi:hypothetical protein
LCEKKSSLFTWFIVPHSDLRHIEWEGAARWALTLFGVYPFAFFQAAGYPESLMIFFSALAILLAQREDHIWAGVALGLGVLARLSPCPSVPNHLDAELEANLDALKPRLADKQTDWKLKFLVLLTSGARTDIMPSPTFHSVLE